MTDVTLEPRECKFCRFFDPVFPDRIDIGYCRKRAPITNRQSSDPIWPTCWTVDWCGEFKRRLVA